MTRIKNTKGLIYDLTMCLQAIKDDDVDSFVSHFEDLRDIVPDSLPEL